MGFCCVLQEPELVAFLPSSINTYLLVHPIKGSVNFIYNDTIYM